MKSSWIHSFCVAQQREMGVCAKQFTNNNNLQCSGLITNSIIPKIIWPSPFYFFVYLL